MLKHDTPLSDNSLNNSQHKGNFRNPQIQTIFRYLMDNTATASMVAKATGIPQKNICRYKRDLEKEGQLWEIVKDTCKATGHKAWYLTTNNQMAIINSPLKQAISHV